MLLQPVYSMVADNLRHPVSPGPLTTILEAVEAGDDAHEAVLRDVEGVFPIWHIPQPHTHRKSGKTLIEALKRLSVASPNRINQLSFCLLHDYLIFFFDLNTNSHADLSGASSSSMMTVICADVCLL